MKVKFKFLFLLFLSLIVTRSLDIFADTSLLRNGNPPSGWVTYVKAYTAMYQLLQRDFDPQIRFDLYTNY